MNFASELFPSYWLPITHILYAIMLGIALWRAPWHHLKRPKDANIFFASCLILWLVWKISGGVTPALEFHLLMITTVTLMFGWQFAIISASIAQLGLSIGGDAHWATYSLNVLINGVIPVWVTFFVFQLVYIWLPRHFFIYVYGIAFFGGALAMLFSRLAGLGLLLMSGSYNFMTLGDEPLFVILLLFPEAFVNGLLITALIVYHPEWVSSFSDKHYLKGK